MRKVWNVVLIVCLALVALGVVAGVIGYFTGGSVDRMMEVYFGGRESFNMIFAAVRDQIMSLF